jgi:hypothetical protein
MKKAIPLLICVSVMLTAGAWKLSGWVRLATLIVSAVLATITLLLAITNRQEEK